MLLPTGKSHVSFSEVKMWKECPWKHKLIHVDKIQLQEPNQHLFYGSIVHDCVEQFLKTREMNVEEAKLELERVWIENGFDSEDFIQRQSERAKRDGWKYAHSSLPEWQQSLVNCTQALPAFMDENFGPWKTIDAEHALMESIEGVEGINFKGFIDAIILSRSADGSKKKVWILDWKTASPRGWAPEKQRDFLMQAQLMLYKSFWANKMQLASKDVALGFVLLKKNTKPEKCIQLIKVSAGPDSMAKAQKLVRSAVSSINNGLKLKNRESCKFCEFRGTEYCT
jgi:hypothetical protein